MTIDHLCRPWGDDATHCHDAMPLLALEDVRFGYENRPNFLGPVSIEVRAGQAWAIVGPNGAGKSTLLRLMAGLLRPQGGSILFEGRRLGDLADKSRARRIAFVPQKAPSELTLSARDVVLLGRFPYRSWSLFESAEDVGAAEQAMKRTETLELADRSLATLSGGEAQRVHMAAALAQQPKLLLLDEPTASLDLKHQLTVFSLLRDLACNSGLSVVVVTHDVNLAARFCSRVLLLHEGGVVAAGATAEVLTPDILEPVYGVTMTTLRSADHSGHAWIVPIDRTNGDAP